MVGSGGRHARLEMMRIFAEDLTDFSTEVGSNLIP